MSTAEFFAIFESRIDSFFHITLQASAKVFEHCRTARKNDIFVQRSSHVNGTILNYVVDDLVQRCREIWIRELETKE